MYIERYSYRDKVTFAEEPGKQYEGGLSFTHDMGNFVTFSGEAQQKCFDELGDSEWQFGFIK